MDPIQVSINAEQPDPMAHSYSYLARKAGLVPQKGKSPHYRPACWVSFFLPEIRFACEPSETRLIRIDQRPTREWVAEMQDGYAALNGAIPTFFPNHP